MALLKACFQSPVVMSASAAAAGTPVALTLEVIFAMAILAWVLSLRGKNQGEGNECGRSESELRVRVSAPTHSFVFHVQTS